MEHSKRTGILVTQIFLIISSVYFYIRRLVIEKTESDHHTFGQIRTFHFSCGNKQKTIITGN